MTAELMQAGLATEINTEHELALGRYKEALEHARRAGELLLQAKAQVAHGEWLPWIETNLKFSARSATGYMLVASRWDELMAKSATVADLGLRGALKCLSAPADRGHSAESSADRGQFHQLDHGEQVIGADHIDGDDQHRPHREDHVDQEVEDETDRAFRENRELLALVAAWARPSGGFFYFNLLERAVEVDLRQAVDIWARVQGRSALS